MVVFRTGFNTGRTGPVLAIPEYMIPDRKRKKKKKEKKKEVDLTHSNSEILLLTPIWGLFILASHW